MREIADRADDVFVPVNAQRDDGNEAEREPGITLDHSGGPVPLRQLVTKKQRDNGV